MQKVNKLLSYALVEKTDLQYNGQKRQMTNTDPQNTKQKTKDSATRNNIFSLNMRSYMFCSIPNTFNKITWNLGNAEGQQIPLRCITESNKHGCADVKRRDVNDIPS
jgi:hypothetical protein